MTRIRRAIWTIGVVVGAGFVATAQLQATPGNPDPPAAVANAFKARFPNGEITKVESEMEHGVLVYDFEFRDGVVEKETDIASDGTVLEFTVVVGAKDIPPAAMKAIQRAAKGATIGRMERVRISHETKDGRIVALPELATRFEVEVAKGKQHAEVVVAPDGRVVEAPEWKAGSDENVEDDTEK